MTIAVLDSNIFISAFLFNGNQRKLLEYALAGKYRIAISDMILDELRDVLTRPKFKLTQEQVKKIINEIEALCMLYFPTEAIKDACRDSDDNIILECAVAAKAEYIITGDDDLLSIGEYKSITIMNSADFLKIVSGI